MYDAEAVGAIVLAGEAGAALVGAAGAGVALKATTSSKVILPPGPDPLTCAISIPLSSASLLALGLANTLSLKESSFGEEAASYEATGAAAGVAA